MPQKDSFKRIYSSRAQDYQRMIAAEDVDNHLSRVLQKELQPCPRRILDIGTGTGRFPLMVKGVKSKVIGIDLHREMLRENLRQRDSANASWLLVQADMLQLPFISSKFDLITAGWAIGHLTGWFPDDWEQLIITVLQELHRVAMPDGRILIFETLSTGGFSPTPPTEALARYYNLLERDWGFSRQVIRTDYQFMNVKQAIEKTAFFFGAELVNLIRQYRWARIPEWTGVWRKAN